MGAVTNAATSFQIEGATSVAQVGQITDATPRPSASATSATVYATGRRSGSTNMTFTARRSPRKFIA